MKNPFVIPVFHPNQAKRRTPPPLPVIPSELTLMNPLEIQKNQYRVFMKKINKERDDWNIDKNQRIEHLNHSLGNLQEVRYWVKKGNVYGNHNPIDLCFDPLLLDRSKIDLATKDLQKECRIRGYSLLGVVGGGLGACFSSFLKVVSNPHTLNWGLGGFIVIITVIGFVIILSLKNTMRDRLRSLNKDRDELIEKAAERVRPFASKMIFNEEELENITAAEDLAQKMNSWNDFEKMLGVDTENQMMVRLRQEDRISSLLMKIKQQIDASNLEITVYFEMLSCLFTIIFLAVIGRVYLSGAPASLAPPAAHAPGLGG